MMKKTKKGITLVELVICCAILVLLGGACTAVLVSGQTVFNTSSKTANAQLDADVLQNYLMNLLPSSKNIAQINLTEAKALSDGNSIFLDKDNDGPFTLNMDGKNTTINSISELQYSITCAGAADSSTARAQFVYTVTLKDGSTFDGGFILANLKYSEVAITPLPDDGLYSISEHPLSFDVPESGT